MRRRVLVILLFLLLGAIVNIIVAWSIWLFGARPVSDPVQAVVTGKQGSLGTREMASWNRSRSDHWPAAPEFAWDHSFFGIRYRSVFTHVVDGVTVTKESEAVERSVRSTQDSYSVTIVECGWPARCMTLDAYYEFHYPTPFTWQTNGLVIGRWHVPHRPYWRAFAINTLFYAVLLWLPFAGVRGSRRFIRRRRGRCLKCGYDLQGELDSGCPECGWKRESHALRSHIAMNSPTQAELLEGLTVDIFFDPRPRFGDLFTVCGYENPQFPPTGDYEFSRLASLGFAQVDDYFGIPSPSSEGDDVIVWLFPLVDGKETYHHPGPFDAIRLAYNVLRNPRSNAPLFIQCVSALADVAGHTATDSAALQAKIDAIADHWEERGITPGSDTALQIDA